MVGFSERWRQEGLGRVRDALVEAPPAPTVLVRRGPRPGGLAPAGDDHAVRLVTDGEPAVNGGRVHEIYQGAVVDRLLTVPASLAR